MLTWFGSSMLGKHVATYYHLGNDGCYGAAVRDCQGLRSVETRN